MEPNAFGMGDVLPPDFDALAAEEPEAHRTSQEILEDMIEDAMLFLDTDQDEQDRFKMTKILSMLQEFLATEQKERDQALGLTATNRVLRRSIP